jgi:hypothetical protein
MTELISLSSKKFSIAAHLGVVDISTTPAAFFPRLREAQWLLCSLHMSKYHSNGGNWYLPVPCDAEVTSHNDAVALPQHWVNHDDPTAPVYVILAGATAVDIENIKMARKIYSDFQDMINDLFVQTIDILGPSLRQQLESEHIGGIPNISNTQLQLWLYNRLGKPSEDDVNALRRATDFRFSVPIQFGQDAAKLKTIYNTLLTLGFPTPIIDQIQQVERNISHSAHMVSAFERYKIGSDMETRTYDAMVRAVIEDLKRLPESTTSQQGYVGFSKSIDPTVDSVANSTTSIINSSKSQQQSVGRGGGRGGSRSSGKRVYGPAGRQPVNGSSSATTTSSLKYCFAHGLNPTHTGLQCFLMRDTAGYTAAMKQATSCQIIDNYQGAPDSVVG